MAPLVQKDSLVQKIQALDVSSQKARENNLVNNILPSYHMFQSTILKNLTPTDENYRVDPPTYEVTPVSSIPTTPGVLLDDNPLEPSNSQISTFNEEAEQIWENTILANAHRLPNLLDSENPLSTQLEVTINVTEQVCQKGMPPTIIDPLVSEYKQGDYIHGYVTITNKSDEPIPFDMVYVCFEGSLVMLDNNRGLIDSNQPQVYKFLNMLDLFASWSYANIDRLVTDNGDPHDWCDGEVDPVDNACLSIDVKRFFQPNITYKRYFTFRIPEKLLDDACDAHQFSKHTLIPPSIGVSRNLQSIPLMYLSNTSKNENRLKDFSFIDTYISYSVDARIIGKASEYGHRPEKPSRHHDQYVIAKELICPIRVVPVSSAYTARQDDLSLFYRAFVDSVKSKISEAQDSETPQLSPVTSSEKFKQLYKVADSTTKRNISARYKHLAQHNNSSGLNDEDYDENVYQCLSPYKKKSFTGSTKLLGVISLSSPKQEYVCAYVPPVKYRADAGVGARGDTSISVPVEVAFFYEPKATKNHQPPEIRLVSSELVVLTVRSKKHQIPLEFNHEMCFKDKVVDNGKDDNNFDAIVVAPFQKYYTQLTNLIRTLGDSYRVESQLFKDVKALAFLQTKYIYLPIEGCQFYSQSDSHRGFQNLLSIPWEKSTSSTNSDYSICLKKFDIKLDLSRCHTKGSEPLEDCFDRFTLVPDFQTCLMARMYYVKISVKMVNGLVLTIHVPLSVENKEEREGTLVEEN